MAMEDRTQNLYAEISVCAREKGLRCTQKALQLIRKQVRDELQTTGSSRLRGELLHGFQVARMLADLNLPLENGELDELLTAALLHVLPEVCPQSASGGLTAPAEFPAGVTELLNLIEPENDPTDEEMQAYYARLQQNRLALLFALADRGNVVQNLYRYSTWNAHRYIDETKTCYYPMCVYGKEHYHELLSPISVLLEKMRSLVEVAEILLTRYEAREAELIHDILALREENATIRGIIAKFRAEEGESAAPQ